MYFNPLCMMPTFLGGFYDDDDDDEWINGNQNWISMLPMW